MLLNFLNCAKQKIPQPPHHFYAYTGTSAVQMTFPHLRHTISLQILFKLFAFHRIRTFISLFLIHLTC